MSDIVGQLREDLGTLESFARSDMLASLKHEWIARVARDAIAALSSREWQPIETAPENKRLLLYFPAMERHRLGELIVVDTHPVHYPRKPTLWAPIPAHPNTTGDARR